MNTNIDKYIESINENKDILNKLLTITKLQNQSLIDIRVNFRDGIFDELFKNHILYKYKT